MKRTLKSPAVWGLIILCLAFVVSIIYMGTALSETRSQLAALESRMAALEREMALLQEEEDGSPDAPVQEPAKPQSSKPVSRFVSKEKVKASILGDLQYDDNPEDLVFLSITLDESQDPPVYDVIAETADKYRKHVYKVNAETGLIRDRVFYNADNFDEEGQIGLYHERGDSSEPEAWNKYWELYCSPSGQAYHEGVPVIKIYTDEWYAYEEAR